ncbi:MULTISPECIES: NADPH:quinone reductase [unclassified Parafrankia]|uniref:NADPH:quinone reductase n=1 Tax=unclassified Parafrankia TaxID=2994368 RepID=UPI000DA5DE12|nr:MULTISPECIES: NADPH:quinone reductase [unclassified Parafrankia]TCJ37615.1 NADPH:quinone reductase [Parafrankia sp. BMG5.11]SQD99744.1 Alcohol dehydrogenase zinc-binding domain protein [Parafrankia sp. Ea1.12]
MRAIVYERTGDSEVLRLVERPRTDPGPGQVRVRVAVSGVNPTDWKARSGAHGPVPPGGLVPNQDGAGVVDAVGAGVDPARVGERVWIWEAAWRRPDGTAQEEIVLPARQAVPLPPGASFDLGASLGIPAMTAHRTLTVHPEGPAALGPSALAGRTVLVAGGAGAVGHAAIELARWSGANVVTTVSSPGKAALAAAAGAHHVVNYREPDAAEAIGKAAPDGVHIVVEVNPGANAELNQQVLATNGVVVIYADGGGTHLPIPILPSMMSNTRLQFILVYTMPDTAKLQAVKDITAAAAVGALRVGTDAGLPLHRFRLEQTAAAHDAVEAGTVGKVLVDVTHAQEDPEQVHLPDEE